MRAVVSNVKENFSGSHSPDGSPWLPLAHARPNSKGADKPLRKNGILLGSVTSRQGEGHYEEVTSTRMEYGTNLDYAATQQYGATIFPRSSKYLAIPLTKEADRAGRARNFGQPLRFQPFSKNSGKSGGFLIEDKRGTKRKAAQAIRHYILVDHVTIPARPFLGWSDDLVDEVGEILSEGVARALLKAPVAGPTNMRLAA